MPPERGTRWRPNALDDGADAGKVQHERRGTQNRAGQQEAAKGNPRSGLAIPPAGDEAQQQGAQRGDKAERKVAARVVSKALRARKEIQEPNVEGLAQVAVLVPVRGKAREQTPVPVGS